jgi:hypothetical protein
LCWLGQARSCGDKTKTGPGIAWLKLDYYSKTGGELTARPKRPGQLAKNSKDTNASLDNLKVNYNTSHSVRIMKKGRI